MEENKIKEVADELLEKVSGGVLDDYGKDTLNTMIRNYKGSEEATIGGLISKIQQMPPRFFAMEIGEDATMEEVIAYVQENWDKFD